MTPVTLDGLAHHALTIPPNLGSVTVRARVETDVEVGLTQRENRRQMGATLRFEVEFEAAMSPAVSQALRNSLRTLGDGKVRLPFWPALDAGSGDWSSRWWMRHEIGDEAGETVSLNWGSAGVVPSLSSGQHRAPTLLGYLTDAPRFTLEGEHVVTGFRFRESSPVDEQLTPAARVWAEGPELGGDSVPMFPLSANEERDAGRVEVDVDRAGIGFGRDDSSVSYPQIGRRRPQFRFTTSTHSEASSLFRFLRDMGGTSAAFWVPVMADELRLASDSSGASADVTVTDASLLGDYRWLAFFAADGSVVTRKVESIAGNILTLDSSPGTLAAASTRISTLALVRFARPDITVRFITSDVAEALVEFIEVPEEYVIASGETREGTIGKLSPRAFLFTVTRGSVVDRFTSYESDLSDGTYTWTARQVTHREVVDGPAHIASSLSIRARHWSGCPFSSLIVAPTDDRIHVELVQCNPTGVLASKVTIFSGFVTRTRASGPMLDVSVESFGRIFDRRVPRVLVQPTDNWSLFDERNGLDVNDWEVTGVAQGPTSSHVVTVELPAQLWAPTALGDLTAWVRMDLAPGSAGDTISTPPEQVSGVAWSLVAGSAKIAATTQNGLKFAEKGATAPIWRHTAGNSNTWTAFAVVRAVVANEPRLIAVNRAGDANAWAAGVSNYAGGGFKWNPVRELVAWGPGGPVNDGAWHVIRFTLTGGTTAGLRLDHEAGGSVSQVSSSSAGTMIETHVDVGLGELIYIKGAISADDDKRVWGVLSHRWGLTANLPTGHEYKSAPPYAAATDPLPANWFALGYVVRPSGQRIPVMSSTAQVGASCTVTLAWAPDPPLAADEEWTLVPGYDGTLETAVDKFANLENFGGFPFAPASNPSLVAVKKDDASAGKK